MNTLADSTFGIKSQALSILAVLDKQEPHFADYENGRYLIETNTYPWYNGRESGVALTVQHSFCGRGLVIVFGECRNSDSIFVDSWEMERLPFNGPTLEHFTEKAYENRECVNYLDIRAAVKIIMDKAAHFYADEKAKAATIKKATEKE